MEERLTTCATATVETTLKISQNEGSKVIKIKIYVRFHDLNDPQDMGVYGDPMEQIWASVA
jgi:hypothetical protein